MPSERLYEADERIDKRYTEGKLMAIVQEGVWDEYIEERIKQHGDLGRDWVNKRLETIEKQNPEIYDLIKTYFAAAQKSGIPQTPIVTIAIHVYDLLEFQAGKYRKEDFEKMLEEMKPHEEVKQEYIRKMILFLKNRFLITS